MCGHQMSLKSKLYRALDKQMEDQPIVPYNATKGGYELRSEESDGTDEDVETTRCRNLLFRIDDIDAKRREHKMILREWQHLAG